MECLPLISGTAEIRAAKISEAHDNGTESLVNQAGFGLSWRDMPKAAWYELYKQPLHLAVL